MKLLHSTGLWLIVGLSVTVVAIVALVAIRITHREVGASKQVDKPKPGFQDYVKNPELWDDVEHAQNDIDKTIEASKVWTDEQVAAAVTRFVLGDGTKGDTRSSARVIRSLGPRAHPILLKLLSDPALRSRLTKPTRENVLPEAPFNRICDLLGDHPLPESAPLIAPYLDDASKEIRKSAALVLASIGTDSIILPVRKALANSDEYVRSYALIGLKRAVSERRLSDMCRKELFTDLQNLLDQGKNSDESARLLLDFDPGRAAVAFTSDALFRPESKSLHGILRALNDKKIRIERDRLLKLIDKLATLEMKYPQTNQLGAALKALGKHRASEDRRVLEKYMSHSDETVAEGAADGMVASHGLDGFEDRIWEALRNDNPTKLTEPQRRYIAVLMFDSEVRNGGLSQYFFNSSGDEWRYALAGLEAMESKERFSILRDALNKFPAGSPSEDRRVRMTQLSKVARKKGGSFDDLDSRYYKCSEIIRVLATRYVLKNADEFR